MPDIMITKDVIIPASDLAGNHISFLFLGIINNNPLMIAQKVAGRTAWLIPNGSPVS